MVGHQYQDNRAGGNEEILLPQTPLQLHGRESERGDDRQVQNEEWIYSFIQVAQQRTAGPQVLAREAQA